MVGGDERLTKPAEQFDARRLTHPLAVAHARKPDRDTVRWHFGEDAGHEIAFREAIDAGVFRTERSVFAGGADLGRILLVLRQVRVLLLYHYYYY